MDQAFSGELYSAEKDAEVRKANGKLQDHLNLMNDEIATTNLLQVEHTKLAEYLKDCAIKVMEAKICLGHWRNYGSGGDPLQWEARHLELLSMIQGIYINEAREFMLEILEGWYKVKVDWDAVAKRYIKRCKRFYPGASDIAISTIAARDGGRSPIATSHCSTPATEADVSPFKGYTGLEWRSYFTTRYMASDMHSEG